MAQEFSEQETALLLLLSLVLEWAWEGWVSQDGDNIRLRVVEMRMMNLDTHLIWRTSYFVVDNNNSAQIHSNRSNLNSNKEGKTQN